MFSHVVGSMKHIPHANSSSTQFSRFGNSFHEPKRSQKCCSRVVISQNKVLHAFTLQVDIVGAKTLLVRAFTSQNIACMCLQVLEEDYHALPSVHTRWSTMTVSLWSLIMGVDLFRLIRLTMQVYPLIDGFWRTCWLTDRTIRFSQPDYDLDLSRKP